MWERERGRRQKRTLVWCSCFGLPCNVEESCVGRRIWSWNGGSTEMKYMSWSSLGSLGPGTWGEGEGEEAVLDPKNCLGWGGRDCRCAGGSGCCCTRDCRRGANGTESVEYCKPRQDHARTAPPGRQRTGDFRVRRVSSSGREAGHTEGSRREQVRVPFSAVPKEDTRSAIWCKFKVVGKKRNIEKCGTWKVQVLGSKLAMFLVKNAKSVRRFLLLLVPATSKQLSPKSPS